MYSVLQSQHRAKKTNKHLIQNSDRCSEETVLFFFLFKKLRYSRVLFFMYDYPDLVYLCLSISHSILKLMFLFLLSKHVRQVLLRLSLKKIKPFAPSDKVCKLCLQEKLAILRSVPSLNKRSNIFGHGIHRKKFLLSNTTKPTSTDEVSL